MIAWYSLAPRIASHFCCFYYAKCGRKIFTGHVSFFMEVRFDKESRASANISMVNLKTGRAHKTYSSINMFKYIQIIKLKNIRISSLLSPLMNGTFYCGIYLSSLYEFLLNEFLSSHWFFLFLQDIRIPNFQGVF